MAFRMDDRKQRIVVTADGGEGIDVFGLEVRDALALDALAGQLDQAGVKVARGSRALADERLVKDLIVVQDPIGNRVELFHGAQTSPDPFVPGRAMSGFRTGPLGLGHIVLTVESVEAIEQLMPFYRDLLGFRLTDYYSQPFEARFLHVNPRHHSLAFIKTGKTSVHHIMMEVFSFDDLRRAYDIAAAAGRVTATMGRHTSDLITPFYSRTPSAFMIEYGWGARSIDPETWQAFERKDGPSMWGHDRTEERAGALRRNLADEMRPLLEVTDGSSTVMAGVCPWWDGVPAKAK
jgi:2,3-dihydroxybiphenyl 1,2-dioxygenase